MALDFIGKRGIGPDHPAMVAAGKGDFGPLKAHLAGLGDKATGYEQFIALGEKAYQDEAASTKTKQEADRKVITEAVGGEESWTQIQQWATANAEPSEKAAVNAALAAGGVQAKAMALYLSDCYAKATGTVINPTEAANGSRGNQAPSNGALSPRDYTAAVRELRNQIGDNLDGSPEYARLQARRAAWQG
jgi:hypothetical protein